MGELQSTVQCPRKRLINCSEGQTEAKLFLLKLWFINQNLLVSTLVRLADASSRSLRLHFLNSKWHRRDVLAVTARNKKKKSLNLATVGLSNHCWPLPRRWLRLRRNLQTGLPHRQHIFWVQEFLAAFSTTRTILSRAQQLSIAD